MTPAAPGGAELLRGIESLRVDIQSLRNDLGTNYVRKDVQDAREIATTLQLTGLEAELHEQGKKITAITTQRESERTAREAQHASDRRLLWSIAVTAILGPIIVALLLHVLGAK